MKSIKLTGAILFSGAMMTGLFGSVVQAADVDTGCVPAVSGVNGKLEGSGGYFDNDDVSSDGRFLGVGTLSLPLGCMFGLQIDAAGGTLEDNGYGGVGGHLFMRDPSSYLLGVHAQYMDFDGDDVFRIDAEAELYLDQLTLSGIIGYEDIEGSSTDNIIGGVEAAYYLTDDFKLSAGLRHFFDVSVGAVGLEYQPEAMPGSVFVDAMFGEDDYVSVTGGLRFYFGGEQKSLKARHREDDPAHYFNWVNTLEQPAPVTTVTSTSQVPN